MIAGGGAAGAAGALVALAERLGAPVITTANGKGTIPDRHPLALGARLNLPAARAWLEACDVVLAVGTELGESDLWGPPLELSGELVRVDIDPLQAHSNTVAAVALIGDAAPGAGERSSRRCGPGAPRRRASALRGVPGRGVPWRGEAAGWSGWR